MNENLQKLLARMSPNNQEEIIIDVAPDPKIINKELSQSKQQRKDFWKNRLQVSTQKNIYKVAEQNQSFLQRRETEDLNYLIMKAKREQKQKDDRQFDKVFLGINKPVKKQKIMKDKLQNLKRYKQLNEEKKPQPKKILTNTESERLRKHLLWQKRCKQAAQMIQRPPDANSKNIVFTKTQITEQITNQYIQHQQTNCSSFLRMILEQDLSSQLLQPEKKKVPERFSGNEEYLKIFQFLIVNQTIASLHNSYKSFANTEQYRNPIKVLMTYNQTTNEGFQIMEMQEIPQQEGMSTHLLKNLTLSKHNLVLVSSNPTPDLNSLSTTNFGKQFLFLGCLITPENKEDLSLNVKVSTMINKKSYLNSKGEMNVKAYVFQFQKISTFIREFLGIRNVQFDDLAEYIYHPSLMNKVRNYVQQPQIFQKFFEQLEPKFNTTQLNSIKELCLRDRGIIMLQGPPGTGKTSTLLGVLSGQYHYIRSRQQLGVKKILVCTPSNTAVDHIVKRILTQGLIGTKGQVIRPKILRTGVVETRDAQVRSVYIDDICEKQVLGNNNVQKQQKRLTIFQINSKIKSMLRETRKLENQYRITKNEEIYKAIRNIIAERQKYQYKAYELRQQRIDQKSKMNEIQRKLLAQSQIILTTLSSTGTQRFSSLKGKFSCLIVDEAGQCTEPNLMIALSLNVPKILLIGDPCQLPATSFSPDSNVTLYNRSLFQRMLDGGLKPYFLDIQYRMCPQIRQFPSRTFYDNRLKDALIISKRQYPQPLCRGFKTKNVWFVDVNYGKQQLRDKSWFNQDEIEVVKRICQRRQLQNMSIGIITPYTTQKNMLKSVIPEDIFVNTIDSFQGQQKDVIVISCVRSSSQLNSRVSVGFLVDERRINVALTRGRFLLIVVGNGYTLGSNEIWHRFLDYTTQMQSYIKMQKGQNGRQIISRMMKGKLTSIDKKCKYQWKKHTKLSRDARKAERQAITLQDFEQGQMVQSQSNLGMVAQEAMVKQSSRSPSKDEVQDKEEDKKGWDVKQILETTEEKLRSKYGNISFFDLINKK